MASMSIKVCCIASKEEIAKAEKEGKKYVDVADDIRTTSYMLDGTLYIAKIEKINDAGETTETILNNEEAV